MLELRQTYADRSLGFVAHEATQIGTTTTNRLNFTSLISISLQIEALLNSTRVEVETAEKETKTSFRSEKENWASQWTHFDFIARN